MTANKVLGDLRKSLRNEMEHATDAIFTGLVVNQPKNCIPESLFRDYFLPCFIGYITTNPNWVMEWVSIAGTPTSEVDVMDETTKEVIYTVPSLFNTSNVFNLEKPVTLNSAADHADQMNNNFPGSGYGFMMEALMANCNEYTSGINFTEVNEKWNKILNYYKLLKTSK